MSRTKDLGVANKRVTSGQWLARQFGARTDTAYGKQRRRLAAAVSSSPPVYPSLARIENLQGVAVIDALVDATGKVTDMMVISGSLSFTQAAMDALRTWKYEPARLNGQPIAMHTHVSINFSLH
jgi:TonB family protein